MLGHIICYGLNQEFDIESNDVVIISVYWDYLCIGGTKREGVWDFGSLVLWKSTWPIPGNDKDFATTFIFEIESRTISRWEQLKIAHASWLQTLMDKLIDQGEMEHFYWLKRVVVIV